MTREDLLQKYNELCLMADAKDKQVNDICYSWGNLEKKYSDAEIKMMIEKLESESEQLRTQANSYLFQYEEIISQDKAKRQAIIDAKVSVKNQFGTSPDDIIITGGVLSANANESHLTGRQKTAEELEFERTKLLASIREKAMKKEISLAEASKLSQDVNMAYGVNTEVVQENTQGGMRR